MGFYSPIGILCQVWYLIVSIPDLCPLYYFVFACHRLNRYSDPNNDEAKRTIKDQLNNELKTILIKVITRYFYI